MTINRLLVLSAAVMMAGAIGATTLQAAADPTPQVSQTPTQSQPEQRQPGQGRRIDFAAAATQLGTTEVALREALGLPAQPRPRPDLQAAATRLGVSQDRLMQALGITIDPQTNRPIRSGNRPNLQTAAAQLGVTEVALREAMGLPAQRPAEGSRQPGQHHRLDIAGAATRLGVTQERLIQALGIQPRSGNPAPTRRDRPAQQGI